MGEHRERLRQIEANAARAAAPGRYTRFIPTLTSTGTDPTGFTIDSWYWESVDPTGAPKLLTWVGTMIGDPGPGVFDPGTGIWQVTIPQPPQIGSVLGDAYLVGPGPGPGGDKVFTMSPAIGLAVMEFVYVDAYPLGTPTVLIGEGRPWTDFIWPGLQGNILNWGVTYIAV